MTASSSKQGTTTESRPRPRSAASGGGLPPRAGSIRRGPVTRPAAGSARGRREEAVPAAAARPSVLAPWRPVRIRAAPLRPGPRPGPRPAPPPGSSAVSGRPVCPARSPNPPSAPSIRPSSAPFGQPVRPTCSSNPFVLSGSSPLFAHPVPPTRSSRPAVAPLPGGLLPPLPPTPLLRTIPGTGARPAPERARAASWPSLSRCRAGARARTSPAEPSGACPPSPSSPAPARGLPSPRLRPPGAPQKRTGGRSRRFRAMIRS